MGDRYTLRDGRQATRDPGSIDSSYAIQAVRIPAPLELGCPDNPGW